MQTQQEFDALVREVRQLAERSAWLTTEARLVRQRTQQLLDESAQRRAAVLDEAPPGKPD
jgi:hypothetical protein